jgi:hypothetical protein
MMSLFEIIKRMPAHGMHKAVVSQEMTFLDWLHHPLGGVADANRQVRQIAGAMDRLTGPDDDPAPEKLLSQAREALEGFAFFGIHEHYSESISVLFRTFGWDPPQTVPRLNPTPAENLKDRLGAKELTAVRQLTELDETLYHFARDHFVRRNRP